MTFIQGREVLVSDKSLKRMIWLIGETAGLFDEFVFLLRKKEIHSRWHEFTKGSYWNDVFIAAQHRGFVEYSPIVLIKQPYLLEGKVTATDLSNFLKQKTRGHILICWPEEPSAPWDTIHTKVSIITLGTPKKRLMSWVAALFKSSNMIISPDTVADLSHRFGKNLPLLFRELDKYTLLSATVDKSALPVEKKISEKLYAETKWDTTGTVVFDFTSAITSFNINRALELLPEVIKSEATTVALAIISLNITRFFMIYDICTNRQCDISGLPLGVLVDNLGVPENIANFFKSNIEKYSIQQLRQINILIQELDYGIKSGRLTDQAALYLLILEFLRIKK